MEKPAHKPADGGEHYRRGKNSNPPGEQNRRENSRKNDGNPYPDSPVQRYVPERSLLSLWNFINRCGDKPVSRIDICFSRISLGSLSQFADLPCDKSGFFIVDIIGGGFADRQTVSSFDDNFPVPDINSEIISISAQLPEERSFVCI